MTPKITFEWLSFNQYEYWTKFNEVPAIYMITNSNNKLVYIGQTWNLKQRHSAHHQEKCFHKNKAHYIYIHQESNEAKRFQIETFLIQKHNTHCNMT